jgi:hypothetical protein
MPCRKALPNPQGRAGSARPALPSCPARLTHAAHASLPHIRHATCAHPVSDAGVLVLPQLGRGVEHHAGALVSQTELVRVHLRWRVSERERRGWPHFAVKPGERGEWGRQEGAESPPPSGLAHAIRCGFAEVPQPAKRSVPHMHASQSRRACTSRADALTLMEVTPLTAKSKGGTRRPKRRTNGRQKPPRQASTCRHTAARRVRRAMPCGGAQPAATR